PLPGPLAHTLALLAMTVATTDTEVVTLDMAPNSFDDQYQGCGPAMTKELPALNRSELQRNRQFSQGWKKAMAEWQRRGSRVSPLSSPDRAIALMAYSMGHLHKEFNPAVREAGRSRREYRDKFHFKALHFLLTQALQKLRDARGQKCHDVFRRVRNVRFEAKRGDTVRFGQFASSSLSIDVAHGYGTDTVFQVYTCHGVDIRDFSYDPGKKEVLIPPFETFEVTGLTQEGNKTQIQLRSTGTHSNYNCKWLRGDLMGTTWEKR
ncbi:NARE ribosyltransferase, partial [Mystacornis crossleyi]|nr:NARE ribosyltransferase [Mystacornis crossleyi]